MVIAREQRVADLSNGKIPKYNSTTQHWEMAEDAGASSGAPIDAPYITRIPDATLTGEFALNSLEAGFLKQSAGTPAKAVPDTDYFAPDTALGVSATEFGCLNNVTSAIQPQLDGKCPSTSGTSMLKGDGAVGTTVAVPGTDYLAPGAFVDRGDFFGWDYTQATLTTDGNWHDLNLSAIVPAGANAVILFVQVTDDIVSRVISFRKNGDIGFGKGSIRTQVVNQANDAQLTIPCDTDRVIEYNAANTTWTTISIFVTGWYLYFRI